ncbi:MAG: amino acid adenylation domain-containing protein, partial [Burkholderiales bacterium]|nr:amino acid adenylation domain-containing protein [Burkholderiales bacterium]
MKKKLDFLLIGNDKMLIQCAEIILENDQNISAIISSKPNINAWSNQHDIPVYNSLAKANTKKNIDYLFNIGNHEILPKNILENINYFPINYHDSLLPEYAGKHATSWVLLNGEKQHGVTWHIITEQTNKGDILKQASIKISDNETELSLNLKCYHLAIQTFSELINELTTENFILKPQGKRKSSFYRAHDKIIGNGWVDWSDSAENLARQFRATTFGHYPNQLGILKTVINKNAYLLNDIKITNHNSTLPPGTIIALNEKGIQIATNTMDIVVDQFKTITGNLLDWESFQEKHILKEGDVLISANSQEKKLYQQLSIEISEHENFWVQYLPQLQATTLPFLTIPQKKQSFESSLITSFKLPNNLDIKPYNTEITLLAILFCYLYRINHSTISVNITNPALFDKTNQFEPLISSFVPLTLDIEKKLSFKEIIKLVKDKYSNISKHFTYLKDIYNRYPALHDKYQPIFIGITLGFVPEFENIFHPITFSINKNQLLIYANKNLLNQNLEVILRNIPGHIHTMLSNINERPNDYVEKIPLLTAKEHDLILNKWSTNSNKYRNNITVSQLFEEQVEKTPDNIAIIFENQKLTYYELNKRANQLANHLQNQGVGRGKLIALFLKRNLDMVVTILAVLKSGSAYVPIDPLYPDIRIQYIISNTNINIVLTHSKISKNQKKLFENNVLIEIDTLNFNREKGIDKCETVIRKESDCAYVLYTSGSTGNPKGVTVLHSSLVNLLLAMTKLLTFKSKDIILAVTPITFDISGLEIFLPLINGAKLILASEKSSIDPYRIRHLLEKWQVTIMQATPSTWQLLIESGWNNYSGIKIISGGEALNNNLALKLHTMNADLWNVYGPTETTIWSTAYQIHQVDSEKSIMPIGKPIDNMQLYVLNEHLKPLPIGFCGELYIGGKGVSEGYLNQPQLTKERFLRNIFNPNAGKLYKTGDLVRWLTDGNLE